MLNLRDFLLFLSLCLFILDLLFFCKLLINLTVGLSCSLGAVTAELIYRLLNDMVRKLRLIVRLDVFRTGVNLAKFDGVTTEFMATVLLTPKEIRLRNPNMTDQINLRQ